MNERLGRGLNALIPDRDHKNDNLLGMSTLPIDQIKPNRNQPRRNFDPDKLIELADSIKENGIIQPLIVTKTADSDYELIAGERRLQAAKLAGLDIVPVVIRSVSHKEQLQLAIVENVQREDLDPIEEALAYHTLADDFSLTHAQIARIMSKERSTVSNSIRLLKLPPEVQAMVSEGLISSGHARAVLSVAENLRVPFAKHIAQYHLSVRQAEDKAPEFHLPEVTAKKAKPLYLKGLESDLTRCLGLKVKVNDHGGNGTVILQYNSQEELIAFKDLINKLKEHR
jgi:ParB family chromosome partitioning protein